MGVPAPDDCFEWRQVLGRPALVCRALEPFAPHLFTTSAWSLGARRVDGGGEDGWRAVSEALGLPDDRLVRATQVHGSAVIVGTASVRGPVRPQADVILLREAEAAAAVQVADCIPLLVVDRATDAVAAAHAGWRGMAARVPQVTITAMARTFGSRADDLMVALGPSIGACCYEVGPDVRQAFSRAGFSEQQLTQWFIEAPRRDPRNPTLPRLQGQPGASDRWFFDGWAATRAQLIDVGVPAGQVYSANLCTASHDGVFCSYRRDGTPSGRIAGAIRSRTRR